jgi:hypothetical protein
MSPTTSGASVGGRHEAVGLAWEQGRTRPTKGLDRVIRLGSNARHREAVRADRKPKTKSDPAKPPTPRSRPVWPREAADPAKLPVVIEQHQVLAASKLQPLIDRSRKPKVCDIRDHGDRHGRHIPHAGNVKRGPVVRPVVDDD